MTKVLMNKEGLFFFLVAALSTPMSSSAQVSDPYFDDDVTVFASTDEVPGQKYVVPISVGDVAFYVIRRQESKASLQTMAGDDVDGNGVRDDVQNDINIHYGSDDYLRTRSLLMAEKFQQITVG